MPPGMKVRLGIFNTFAGFEPTLTPAPNALVPTPRRNVIFVRVAAFTRARTEAVDSVRATTLLILDFGKNVFCSITRGLSFAFWQAVMLFTNLL